MKGCARTCLLQLLGWLAASGGFFSWFRTVGDVRPQLYWASLGAGLCVALTAAYIYGIVQAWSERKTLLGAMSGEPPADGEWAAISGRIQSSEALRAPLTGESVVAYEYRISRTEGSGKHRTDVTLYKGKALVPSTIASRFGAVRLLAFPLFTDVAPAKLPAAAIQNARDYIATTTFETKETPKDQRTKTEDEWTDDDGNFRVDEQPVFREVDPAECNLQEKHLRQGETVCVFGLYSQQRGGIIPHENWAKQTRIMQGDAETVAGMLRSRMIKYVIGVIFFAGATYGVVRLYAHYVLTQTGG